MQTCEWIAAALTLRFSAAADAKAAAPGGPLVLGLLRGVGHCIAPLVRRLRLRNALQQQMHSSVVSAGPGGCQCRSDACPDMAVSSN
jgi:hypothetical protein